MDAEIDEAMPRANCPDGLMVGTQRESYCKAYGDRAVLPEVSYDQRYDL